MRNEEPNFEHLSSVSAGSFRFAIVASRYNETIAKKLVSSATDCLIEHGCPRDRVELFWVPGSYEISLGTKLAAGKKRFDAVIGLGSIVKGETDHDTFIAQAVAQGCTRVSLDTGTPVVFGVITAKSMDQALVRAGIAPESRGKGWDAAATAIEMAALARELGE